MAEKNNKFDFLKLPDKITKERQKGTKKNEKLY